MLSRQDNKCTDEEVAPPPPYHAAMAEMHQNSSFAGGRYMPMQGSDDQKNYVNFFYMSGVHGNMGLGGADTNELYGALEKLSLVRNGKHNFDPSKISRPSKSVKPEDDPNDEIHHIERPPTPPPEWKCTFCDTTGGVDKVRKISQLKLEACKACLRQHWKADFESFWDNSDPSKSEG